MNEVFRESLKWILELKKDLDYENEEAEDQNEEMMLIFLKIWLNSLERIMRATSQSEESNIQIIISIFN